MGFKEGAGRDKVDLYTFDLNQQREVDITLNKLKGNANIKLIDEDGETVLDRSTNKGKKSERIREVLESGSYYVEVSVPGNIKTNYQLSVSSEKIDNVVDSPKKEEIYKAGTWVAFENRVSLQIPKGWVGGVTSNYDETLILASSKKYPDVDVEIKNEGYLTGSMRGFANNWNQPFESDGVTFQPQGKAKIKGNKVTNTYIAEDSELQEKLYLVATIGPNNEIATVLVGGTENKLKDYKDIANNVVNNLDFPEPTDWESYLSDRWLSYYFNSDLLEIDLDFNGVINYWEEHEDQEISIGIFLHGDRSFSSHYDSYNETTGTTQFIFSGIWDITNKNELALYDEDGGVSVEPIFGPDLDKEVIYNDITYSVHNIN
ncbi:MAG: PPC domain-containing protein [Cyanobacteriota bacterium]|nr:PPC domain-containing protein [Cyanobacteriota bacterium]